MAPVVDEEEEEGEEGDHVEKELADIEEEGMRMKMKKMKTMWRGRKERSLKEKLSNGTHSIQPSFLHFLELLGTSCSPSLHPPLYALSPCFLRSLFTLLHQ